MTALSNYLANGGEDYFLSEVYQRRLDALITTLEDGVPLSLAAMAEIVGLPVPVLKELFVYWLAEREAAASVKH